MDLIRISLTLISIGMSVAALLVARQAAKYARQAEIALKRTNTVYVAKTDKRSNHA